MNRTILIVEDHQETSAMIEALMESKGFHPICAGTLAAAKESLNRYRPELIILDLALPDGSGLELCRQARASGEFRRTPIIALTGLTEFRDKKLGFEAGVDQYLEKPLATEELYLWSAALLRRAGWAGTGASFTAFGDLRISWDSFLVEFRGSVAGNLTSREFDLFTALVKATPTPLSRKKILTDVWKTAAVENLVDTHIHNLRRKLPKLLAARIQSVPGRGFRYFPPRP